MSPYKALEICKRRGRVYNIMYISNKERYKIKYLYITVDFYTRYTISTFAVTII